MAGPLVDGRRLNSLGNCDFAMLLRYCCVGGNEPKPSDTSVRGNAGNASFARLSQKHMIFTVCHSPLMMDVVLRLRPRPLGAH